LNYFDYFENMEAKERPAFERRFFLREGAPVWPVDVRSIGQEMRPNPERVERPQGAPFFIVMWTLQGTGKLTVKGKIHSLKPG
jgi:hypothetical protein